MTSQSESSARSKHDRRRRLIVDKPFQYRLIAMLLAIWAANSIFFSILLYYFYEGHIRFFYDLVPRGDRAPLIALSTLFGVTIGFVLLFGLVILTIIGTYLSNQIAGPLYRVKMSLNRVSEGDVNFEVQFREGDFLRDFPGYFNHMLRSLKEQGLDDIAALKKIHDSLSDPARARELIREFSEKKKNRMGITAESPETAGNGEPVTEAVH